MAKCSVCGAPNKPLTVYDDRINMCGDCAFRVSVVSRSIIECINIMQDIFTHCPNPRDLTRVFSFMRTYISGLFDDIASVRIRNNIWQIITHVSVGMSYNLGTEEFYNHPDHLEIISETIQQDMNLLTILRDDAFQFARTEQDLTDHIPPETTAAEIPGMWDVGEQLVLESLSDPADSDEDDMLF